jgi:signal recognition particle subunit SRP54
MGDVLTLVEQAQKQYDATEAAKLEAKMAKGAFTFDDFLEQMKKVKGMGSLKDIMKKIPGMSAEVGDMEIDDGEIVRMEAIVHSMTRRERQNPSLIDTSRRRRIARGSGTEPQDVSGLVKMFSQMRDAMKMMANMNFVQRLRFGTQLSKMAGAGGMLPKFKGSTDARRRQPSQKDKRRERKKHRR